MSSERGRVALIFGVVALLAGGGGYYFFKVYRPAQVRQGAQDEIVAWETRFDAARSCLLGTKPGSSKTSEALAIREMAPDPWDRQRCTPLISKLSRGEAADTGLPEIEAAWVDLDHAAAKAATAFATHVGSSTTLKQDPLPAALDGLDAARAKLRSLAGLPAAAQAGTPLQPAAVLPLADGAEPIVEVRVDTVPSAHGIVLFGDAKQPVQLALATGAKPQVTHGTAATFRAVPDMTWGANNVVGELSFGAMDVDGKIATPTTVKGDGKVAAVGGTLADGRIVYGLGDGLVIAHAKGGAITSDPATKVRDGQAVTDLDGRIAMIWQVQPKTGDPELWGQILKPGGDEAAVDLGAMPMGALCMTKTRAWVATSAELVGFGGGQPVTRQALPDKILVGCTPDAVLLREFNPRKPLTICGDTCRDVAMPTGAPEFSAATVVAGKLVAIASHGGVLGVWREGTGPTFYGLPEVADPVLAHEWPAMALTDGASIDVLARGAKSFAVIRIPAK